MGEAKRKASLPALISVLIPERGRPEMLERLITSLLHTANDDRIEILVAIDNDDEAWFEREPHQHVKTRYFRRPRPATLGEKLNALSREAKGDILWFIANDYVMDTNGWPDRFRAAVKTLPNGIGVPFPHDDLHPDHTAFPIITRRTMEAVGFFVPPCYPYWFVDTHWDQLGIMLGARFEIDVTVSAPEGRGQSHGLIDLPFWVGFFQALAPIRMREAIQLASAAYGDGSPAFTDFMRDIGERQQYCAQRVAHLASPEFLAHWGGTAASPPAASYPMVKRSAEQMMESLEKYRPRRRRVAIAVPSGRTWEATTANCVAALAAHTTNHGIEICMLNVQSSDIAHGRNSTVEIAMREGCDTILWIDSDMRFPPDMLVRLMAHDKDIVGATYCKRTPSADGTYPILGKFAGPKPDVMTDGLHKALLLPGGLMLVKMDVYRKIGWPYYAMAYRWPGTDGLEAFKGLLRNYFYGTPPEAALDELDGTALGAWLRTNYVLGEYGEDVPTFSEDLFFCRRARKANYEIFADVKLTGECAHLGEHAVTCLLGTEVVRLADAAD